MVVGVKLLTMEPPVGTKIYHDLMRKVPVEKVQKVVPQKSEEGSVDTRSSKVVYSNIGST